MEPIKTSKFDEKHGETTCYVFMYIIIEPYHFKDLSIESQTDAWVQEGFEA